MSVVDTSNCDKEPVQFIETIQPFGALVAIDAERKIVRVASSPALELDAEALLGTDIKLLLDGDAEQILQSSQGRIEPTTPILIRFKDRRTWLSCVAHNSDSQIVFEFEPLSDSAPMVPSVKFMTKRDDSLESYLSYIVENIRTWIDYDRVMIYKFADDWHGRVVAESKVASAHSFYDHHFPASDIPEPARRLFTLNWVRMIADVGAEPCAMASTASGADPIDLSRSALRAASPIHIEYLRNMSVGASLTLSIICDNKLWGLIACHHSSPKYLSADHRSVCSLLAKVVSSRVTSLKVAETVAHSQKLTEFFKVMPRVKTKEEFVEAIRDNKHRLFEFVKADGFSLGDANTLVSEGNAISHDQMLRLIQYFDKVDTNFVSTESLGSYAPELADMGTNAAGIAAFRLGEYWAVWNKAEVAKTLVWAGDPNKAAYMDQGQSRLTPRLSFESWREQKRGTSTSWAPYEIEGLGRLRQGLSELLDRRPVNTARVDASGYLTVLRKSIANQASELKSHFKDTEVDQLSN